MVDYILWDQDSHCNPQLTLYSAAAAMACSSKYAQRMFTIRGSCKSKTHIDIRNASKQDREGERERNQIVKHSRLCFIDTTLSCCIGTQAWIGYFVAAASMMNNPYSVPLCWNDFEDFELNATHTHTTHRQTDTYSQRGKLGRIVRATHEAGNRLSLSKWWTMR